MPKINNSGITNNSIKKYTIIFRKLYLENIP